MEANDCSSGLAEKEVNFDMEGENTEALVRERGLLRNDGCSGLTEKEVHLGDEEEMFEFLGKGRGLLGFFWIG
ncbi:hypothetical protein AMTR_s00015p00033830 [Amborella trichopoda]|uniref:Uncharacterized protein n=1 Tax=Amborella trichopoda TaxID=13333 RepID=W1PM34_AMBTC|nr:hypothetical protein AMTR_s00015p00033830 [Amborella trichopoda]